LVVDSTPEMAFGKLVLVVDSTLEMAFGTMAGALPFDGPGFLAKMEEQRHVEEVEAEIAAQRSEGGFVENAAFGVAFPPTDDGREALALFVVGFGRHYLERQEVAVTLAVRVVAALKLAKAFLICFILKVSET
jgi:hypothetical protein